VGIWTHESIGDTVDVWGFGGTSRFVTRWTFGDLVARVDRSRGGRLGIWWHESMVTRWTLGVWPHESIRVSVEVWGLWWHESVRVLVDVWGFGGTSRFGVDVSLGPVFLLHFHLLCPESVGPVPGHFRDSGAKAPSVAGRDSVA
jgi:hypothetical protein